MCDASALPSACEAQPPKWAERTAKLFDRIGQDWWKSTVPEEATLDKWPGLWGLTDHMFDLLAVKQIALPSAVPMHIDLSQGSGRSTVNDSVFQTVTPGSMLFRSDRCRCMIGLDRNNIAAACSAVQVCSESV